MIETEITIEPAVAIEYGFGCFFSCACSRGAKYIAISVCLSVCHVQVNTVFSVLIVAVARSSFDDIVIMTMQYIIMYLRFCV